MMHAEAHVSSTDPFATAETELRADRYFVSGIPHVRIDGKYSVVGAGSCASAATNYRTKINQRMTETGGVSPVDVTGYFTANDGGGSLSATFELIDPGTFSAHQGTLFLIEDDVTWCCGYGGEDHWEGVVRVIRTQPVGLSTVGQQVTIETAFNLETSWNRDNLRAIAIFEEVAGQKTVIQAGSLNELLDYTLLIPQRVVSIPNGNGVASLAGTIENTSTLSDVLSLSIDSGFGWPAEFQVEGDPSFYTSYDLALEPGEIKGFNVRVQTDGVTRIGAGAFETESQNSTRVQTVNLRVFNGSEAILFVDDDNNTSYELPFETALTNLGYLYEDWNVSVGHNGSGPREQDLLGFDAVVWQTAYQTTQLVTAGDATALKAYLDQDGGGLFLSSMDFLGTQGQGNDFTHLYLGIASWVNSSKANVANGVPGDPITDGMVLPLTYPQSNMNRVDTVNPEFGASPIFYSETAHPNALRFELSNSSRTVFSSIVHDAFSTSDPDPNNSETVIERILDWLLESDITDVDPVVASGTTRLLTAEPNPFRLQTEVTFALSPRDAGAVSLTLVDAAGREVRRLHAGKMPAGIHRIGWNGTDDLGRMLPAGVYFTRLRTEEGTHSDRVVYLR